MIATDKLGIFLLLVGGTAVVVNSDDEPFGFLYFRGARGEDTDGAKTDIALRFDWLARALTREVNTKAHFPRCEQGALIAGRAWVDPGMLIYIAVTIIFWLRAPDAVVDVKNHVLRGTVPPSCHVHLNGIWSTIGVPYSKVLVMNKVAIAAGSNS